MSERNNGWLAVVVIGAAALFAKAGRHLDEVPKLMKVVRLDDAPKFMKVAGTVAHHDEVPRALTKVGKERTRALTKGNRERTRTLPKGNRERKGELSHEVSELLRNRPLRKAATTVGKALKEKVDENEEPSVGGGEGLSEPPPKSPRRQRAPTSLTVKEADRLSKVDGPLYLGKLTALSDTAAECLGRHVGDLHLWGLTKVSDTSAESLRKNKGFLSLVGVKTLSDAAAESLSRHRGILELQGLTSLSDEAAESLRKHEDGLILNLDKVPPSAANILRLHPSLRKR